MTIIEKSASFFLLKMPQLVVLALVEDNCIFSQGLLANYQESCNTHPKYKSLYDSQSEDWLINEAFIHYFISIGKINLNDFPEEATIKKFRLAKFLNELPTFSKDKRGNNIPILIVQLMYMLNRSQYGAVIDRVDALNMYCSRYLKKDETFRSNCFIKMLLELPAANFHQQAVLRKVEKQKKVALSSFF